MNRTTGEATAVKKMANAPIQKNLSDQLSEGGEEYFWHLYYLYLNIEYRFYILEFCLFVC